LSLSALASVVYAAPNPCSPTSAPTGCQPHWLDTGSTSWQLTAATFVALMSVPGLALLYGGLVPKKWVVNTMFMAFTGFCTVLVVWALWAYKMGFGAPIGGGGANHYSYTYGGNFFKNFFSNFIGHPQTSLRGTSQTSQASLPTGTAVPLSQPTTSIFYFQFVFAAITPLLFLGSVLGRIKIKVWLIFVPLWTTFVYAVNAMLLWGGGYWAHEGAVDFSGGYVIHLAAGTSGFVAAWVIGPRLTRDRQRFVPHSLPIVCVGAGIVWLGWNGFNGGDPYFASANAATAVVNTNLCTVAALLTWVLWDMFLSREKKPTFLGAVNGMIVGLVAITPGAGYVNGLGALLEGIIASTIVWFAWTYVQPILLRRVDDAMGVVYTHGLAGLLGGLLVGIFADPSVVVYPNTTSGSPLSVTGWFYGNRHLFFLQIFAALTVIVWDAVVTFLILKVIGLVTPLRMSDEELAVGDLAVHGEEGYPSSESVELVGAGSTAATGAPTAASPTSATTPASGAS
jgi:Amt family ammonium transporter